MLGLEYTLYLESEPTSDLGPKLKHDFISRFFRRLIGSHRDVFR